MHSELGPLFQTESGRGLRCCSGAVNFI